MGKHKKRFLQNSDPFNPMVGFVCYVILKIVEKDFLQEKKVT